MRFRTFFSVAGLTLLETVRQPVFMLVSATCVAGISLMPFVITHTLGEGEKIVRDSALAFHLVCGLVLGAYAAGSALTREIQRGTASSVLSKPVSRDLFFLAKYAGIAGVLILFSCAAFAATLLAVRTASGYFELDWISGGPLLAVIPLAFALGGLRNYLTHRSFPSSVFGFLFPVLGMALAVALLWGPDGPRVPVVDALPWHIAPASFLGGLAILVLAGISLSLATFLGTVPILVVCSGVFMAGLMSDYLLGRHAHESLLAAALYAILPNWQNFWVTDALQQGTPIPAAYVGQVLAYATLFLAGILGLGMARFRHVEIS